MKIKRAPLEGTHLDDFEKFFRPINTPDRQLVQELHCTMEMRTGMKKRGSRYTHFDDKCNCHEREDASKARETEVLYEREPLWDK